MKIKNLKRNGFSFYFVNRKEFEILWHNIFKKEEYKVDLKTSYPFIIDTGAHIGLATIYFKNKYPQAKIIAFEPNPQTAKILKLNLKTNPHNKLSSITKILEKAHFNIDILKQNNEIIIRGAYGL